MSGLGKDGLLEQDDSSKIRDKLLHPIHSVICSAVCTGLFTHPMAWGTERRVSCLLFCVSPVGDEAFASLAVARSCDRSGHVCIC